MSMEIEYTPDGPPKGSSCCTKKRLLCTAALSAAVIALISGLVVGTNNKNKAANNVSSANMAMMPTWEQCLANDTFKEWYEDSEHYYSEDSSSDSKDSDSSEDEDEDEDIRRKLATETSWGHDGYEKEEEEERESMDSEWSHDGQEDEDECEDSTNSTSSSKSSKSGSGSKSSKSSWSSSSGDWTHSPTGDDLKEKRGADTSNMKVDGPLRGRRHLNKETVWDNDGYSSGSRYPYLVSIGSTDQGHECSGTLITKTVVLTSAHCFNYPDGSTRTIDYVDFHRVDLTENEKVVRVYIEDDEDVHVHEHFDYHTLAYDYALIFLPITHLKSIVDLEHIRTVEMNEYPEIPNNDNAHEGDDAVKLEGYGWGFTNDDPHVNPDEKHGIMLDYVPNGECMKSPYEWMEGRIEESMLCAYTDDEEVCNGDSGGPLIKHTHSGPVQVGILSFVAKDVWGNCIIKAHPHVFARISKGLPWIKEKVCHKTGDLCPSVQQHVNPTKSSTHAPTKWKSSSSTKSSKKSSSKSSKGSKSTKCSSKSSKGSKSKEDDHHWNFIEQCEEQAKDMWSKSSKSHDGESSKSSKSTSSEHDDDGDKSKSSKSSGSGHSSKSSSGHSSSGDWSHYPTKSPSKTA